MPTIDNLNIEISTHSQKAANGVNALVASLGSLRTAVAAGSGLAQSLSSISTALQGISNVRFSAAKLRNITGLTTALSSLNAGGAANMNATASALSALAASLSQLNASNLSSGNVRNLTNLVTQTGRSGGGSSILGKLVSTAGIRMFAHGISSVIELSNQYQEDLNLFTASLGKYAAEAQNYAETVSEAFGIDPAIWLRNQGVFQTLITGFGVANDRAYKMSTNLTQLGYDISSFFNVTVQDAMTKLQSGISGELEPLRRLGFDLSEARLKAIALSKGIETSYKQMTQAEKSQLRYEAIMTQVTVAQGDMSRTLNAPANQLRILQAMATQAGRALGNVFIPMLNAIIPVAVAVVKAIRNIANAIASLFGFTLAEVDYSGLNDAAGATGELADNLDAAGGGAQKLKKALMGFDEINQLPDFTESGGGGGAASGGDNWEWDLSGYDFLGGAVSSRIDEVFNKIKPVVEWIEEHTELIGIALSGLGTVIALLPEHIRSSLLDFGKAGVEIALDVALQLHFTKDFLDTGSLSAFGSSILTTAIGTSIGGSALGKFLSKISKGKLGANAALKWGKSVVLGIDAIAQIYAVMSDTIAYDAEWSWEYMVSSAKSSLEGGLAAYLGLSAAGVGKDKLLPISLMIGGALEITQVLPSVINGDLGWETFVSEALGAIALTAGSVLLLGTAGWYVGLGVAAALIIGNIVSYFVHKNDTSPSSLDWSGVQMSADECAKLAQDIFDSIDVTAKINVTRAAVKNERKLLAEVESALWGFLDKLNTRDIAVLDTTIDAEVKLKTTSEEMLESLNTLLDNVRTHMSESENTVKAFVSMGGFRDEHGKEIDISSVFTGLDAQALKTGDSLGKALQEGIQNGFTSELNRTIAVLQTDMLILTNAMTGATTEAAANQQADALLAKVRTGNKTSYDQTVAELNKLIDTTRIQLTEDYEARQLELYTQKAAWENVIKSYDEQIAGATTPEDIAYWKDQRWEAYKNLITVSQALNEFDVKNSVEGAIDELFGPVRKEIQWIFDLNSADAMAANIKTYAGRGDINGFNEFRESTNDISLLVRTLIGGATGETVGAFSSISTESFIALQDAIGTDAQTLASTLQSIGLTVFGAADELAKANIPETIRITLSLDGNGNYVMPTITAHAAGGFPASGSLFIAGERGPELVGRIGNKTAVVNDDQISDTLAKQMGGEMDEVALASAIVGAMKSAGMGAVYLDGKQLAASINNETRRSGRPAVII